MSLFEFDRQWWKPNRHELLMAMVAVILFWINHAVAAQTPHCSAEQLALSAVLDDLPSELRFIPQLTHRDFQVRSNAESELRKAGHEVWDLLAIASISKDPELARSASRLLNQIPYQDHLARWLPEYSNYQDLTYAERARTIILLGHLGGPNEQTVLALLTRYEPDEVLSRFAAIELVSCGVDPIPKLGSLIKTCPRVGAKWLRAHANTHAGRESFRSTDFQAAWHSPMQHLASEAFANEIPGCTCRLLRWYAEQSMSRAESTAVDWAVTQLVDRVDQRPEDVIELFDWLLRYRLFDGAVRVCERFESLIPSDARLIVRKAELLRVQGNSVAANQLVDQISYPKDENISKLQLAVNLQLAGYDYWADRQFQALVADVKVETSVRVQASTLLAELQFHEGRHRNARDSLALALDLLQKISDDAVTILAKDEIITRFCLFSHFVAVEDNDWQTARQMLLQGLQQAPEQSDLLIAAVRLSKTSQQIEQDPVAVADWQAMANELVQLALQSRLDRVKSLRMTTSKDSRHARLHREMLVSELNSYAWLASQTGVALESAERMAREAWRLSPGNSHVLDTLAATLFSQSKMDEAIAIQQRALRVAPWSKEIQSGLVRYRSAMMLSEMPTLFR